MPEFHVTFGHQWGAEEYGADPHPAGGYDFVHRDGYWTIVARNQEDAQQLASAITGNRYAGCYDAATHETGHYPRGEMLRLVHPAMREHAVHLLVGPVPDVAPANPIEGRLLVTVWGDGTGEVAYNRHDVAGEGRWGVPAKLEPAP